MKLLAHGIQLSYNALFLEKLPGEEYTCYSFIAIDCIINIIEILQQKKKTANQELILQVIWHILYSLYQNV